MSPRTVNRLASRLAPLLVLVLTALTLWSVAAAAVGASPSPSAGPTALLELTSHGQILGFQPGGYYISSGTCLLQAQFEEAQPPRRFATIFVLG